MAFDEVRFPVGISYGATFGAGHSTAIVLLPDTDAEERIARGDGARRKYDASMGVKTRDDVAEVQTFYLARRGALRGFRFKDWSDYTSAANGSDTPGINDQEIGSGDGTTTTFQLQKQYASGAAYVTRLIEKPVSGTVRVAVDGVEAMSGWSVDTTTGIVTFGVAPTAGKQITAGFEFDVPVRFEKSADEWMQVRIEAYEHNDIPSIPLIELRNETPIDDEYWYGGSAEYNPLSENISISVLTGRAISVNPSASGKTITLPDPTDLSAGGPYFIIVNRSGTDSVALKNESASTIATIAALGSVMVLILVDALGAKYWVAV